MAPSLLYHFVANCCYQQALGRLASHPGEAYKMDRYYDTVLHLLCRQECAGHPDGDRLFKALVNQHPDLIVTPDDEGWTPLHFCLDRDLPNTTWALLFIQAAPEAVSMWTTQGSRLLTPFHIACERNADTKVLRAMLEMDPSLASQPCVQKLIPYATDRCTTAGKSPLELQWESYGESKDDDDDKLQLVLSTAFSGNVPLDPKRNLLHAACAFQQHCPLEYLERILERFPKQVFEADENGNLPLHYAVQYHENNVCKTTTTLLGGRMGHMANKHYMLNELQAKAHANSILTKLLHVYPQAASMRNANGQLALHVALSNPLLRKNHVAIQKLVLANPQALYASHPLYPALMSADGKSRFHLSIAFDLLRAAPDIILFG